jgi:hypothetical protein
MIIRNLQMKVNLRIFGHSVVVISRHSVRIYLPLVSDNVPSRLTCKRVERDARAYSLAWMVTIPCHRHMVSCCVTSTTYGGAEKASISPHGVCCQLYILTIDELCNVTQCVYFNNSSKYLRPATDTVGNNELERYGSHASCPSSIRQ